MNPFRQFVLFLIRVYRGWLSPLKRVAFGPGTACRFEPSCSAYAHEAISRHGLARGGALAVGRLCRCHPWGGMGFDPVPPRSTAPKVSSPAH